MANEFFPEMQRRRFVLDGAAFDDLDGFYREIARVLTRNLEWQPGHNLDALNDLLRGGFGMHGYGEPILLEWRHFAKSRRALGDNRMLNILTVILDAGESGHNCKLEIYE